LWILVINADNPVYRFIQIAQPSRHIPAFATLDQALPASLQPTTPLQNTHN
jgi:hypothetical protein